MDRNQLSFIKPVIMRDKDYPIFLHKAVDFIPH